MVLLVIVDDYSMEMHDAPVFEKNRFKVIQRGLVNNSAKVQVGAACDLPRT